MSKNNLIGSRSISPASFNSLRSDSEKSFENGLDEALKSKNRPASTNRTSRAKRVRFFHNGNKFFTGAVIPVAPERYRSFDSLTNELTTIIGRSVTLPNGVRNIYSMEGKKILSIEDLEDGKEYVVSGKGEAFKKIEYSKTDTLKSKKVNRNNSCINTPPTPKITPPDCVRPRIVTIIKNGIKPRKILRILLNKRNSSSFESVLSAFSEIAQLAVRKTYTISGKQVTCLQHLFESEDVFFIYGNEKHCPDDLELDFEETKTIQQFRRTPGLRNGTGPKPKMPKKEKNKTFVSEENLLRKLSLDNNISLPSGMKGKYSVGRMIGDGNFAVVRLCKHTITEKEYALKIIDKSKCKGKKDMIENEVKILRMVSHPNIISLIEDHDTKSMLYLVCEYVAGGDLFDVITVAQKFSEEQAALMIKHLVSALAYLHNLNVVHRDIKPENLLVEMDNGRVKCLKLGDFGLACEVNGPLFTVCGTPTYVAPEILEESGYGLKIDVWAAGVILYILLCGYPPFASQDNDQEKLFDCILSGQYDFPDEFWQDVSYPAKELIQNMLQLQPELRFSAEDVLDHPWLQLAN
ncbi:serine/threonine-protein kinase GM11705 [Anthonomus grandis grandis]|uniref:serine/threonine-protein kinase GM11705 n=1 Tax=Anthonomus grandis grandis TaxID=2921223 RepID=UPI002165409E|nr:serine/threonine-protein kinase GM11705 [Anthonomus grandis grandis]XP_050294266.1 serine/threonine-protein kinase GM11705 [Anthonomus grandis grandis]